MLSLEPQHVTDVDTWEWETTQYVTLCFSSGWGASINPGEQRCMPRTLADFRSECRCGCHRKYTIAGYICQLFDTK